MSSSKLNIAPVAHLEPAFVANIVSGATNWETLNFREAFEAGAAERAAVTRVLEANVDVPYAVHVVRQSMQRVNLLMPEIEKLPVRVDLIKRADFYARGTIHAQVLYTASIAPPERLQAVYEEALVYRGRVRSDIENLVEQGILPPEALDGIGTATGFRNVAYDTQKGIARLRAYESVIAGQGVLKPAALDRIEALANELEDLYTRRETSRGADPKIADERDRAFTLMHDSFEWARCAVTLLRWFHGDAKEIAPSMFSTVEAKEAKAKAERAKAAKAKANGESDADDAELDSDSDSDPAMDDSLLLTSDANHTNGATNGATTNSGATNGSATGTAARASANNTGMRGSNPFGE